MSTAFARVYSSFQEFERLELRKLDCLYDSVDGMVDEMLLQELEDEAATREGGSLFDEIEDAEDEEEDVRADN